MRNLLIDLRFGLRMLSKYPGLSLLAVLAVALGMHLLTGQIIVINGILFRGLPVPDEHELVAVSRVAADSGKRATGFLPGAFEALAARQESLAPFCAYYEGTVNFSDGREPKRFNGAFISWDFLDALKVGTVLGRGFRPEDDVPGAPPVVILSHEAWKREFGSDPLLIGRPVTINSVSGTVVGVLAPGIRFPLHEDAWVPRRAIPHDLDAEEIALQVFGRLEPGVTVAAAQAGLGQLAAELAGAKPDLWKDGHEIRVDRFAHACISEETAHVLWIMMVAVVFVLLIACANVANLLLARSSVRGRELAVRSALGASRLRLIRQMLIESFVLCLTGATIGAMATVWTMDGLVHELTAEDQPFWMRIELDRSVLLVVIAFTVASALVAGIIPAWKASRVDVVELLKETGRTSANLHVGFFSRVLISVQVALSFSLLIVAGLMLKTMHGLRVEDVPFEPAEVLSARFGLFAAQYPGEAERVDFLETLLARLEMEPAVDAAAITTRLQFSPGDPIEVSIPGRGGEKTTALVEAVSPDYFRAMGVPLVAGRSFEPAVLRAPGKVAVVNASFVRRLLGPGEAIGREFVVHAAGPETFTIIGVAPDLRMNGIGAEVGDQAGFYVPIEAGRERFFTVIVRARGDAARTAAMLRKTAAAVAPDLPLYWVQTYAGAIERELAGFRIVTTMFLIFGGAAALLAATGIYGVVSFNVTQRTPEIGIRLALGAHARAVLGMIIRQGAVQLCAGLLAGAVFALVLGSLLRRFVVGIGSQDLLSFVLVGAMVSLVALVASFMPAQRAVRMTPLAALRHE